MIAALSVGLMMLGGAAIGDELSCVMAQDCNRRTSCAGAALMIEFAIDRNQFAPAVDPADPPRRKVTQVTAASEIFIAEPILMASGIRGFWTDDPAIGTHFMTIQPDSSASYSAPDGTTWTGTCKDTG